MIHRMRALQTSVFFAGLSCLSVAAPRRGDVPKTFGKSGRVVRAYSNAIYFFDAHTNPEAYFLSNFYLAPVTIIINNAWHTFATAEAAFQAGKYPNDDALIGRLAVAADGQQARQIGLANRIQNPTWTIGGNVFWMRRVLWAKFSQNAVLRMRLLETGSALLIDGDPNDAFWGGTLPNSQNMLGHILMSVRAVLRRFPS